VKLTDPDLQLVEELTAAVRDLTAVIGLVAVSLKADADQSTLGVGWGPPLLEPTKGKRQGGR
jgi:hypothetical protein